MNETFCDKIIVFSGGNNWYKYLFDDVKNLKNIEIGSSRYYPGWSSNFAKYFSKLIFESGGDKGNKQSAISKLLMNKMAKDLLKKNANGAILLLNRTNALAHNTFFLEKIRSLGANFKLVYWFTDLVSAVEKNVPNILELCKKYYDLVVTYEPNDAKRYNFTYLETPYGYSPILTDFDIEYDLVYIGKSKIDIDPNRFKKIISIYEAAKKANLRTFFLVQDVPKNMQKYPSDIEYNTLMSYEQVVKTVLRSKCILEVSQQDEKGTTLRLFEAMKFHKKLYFTNKNLMSHVYFNKNNMRYIDCADLNNIIIDKSFIDSPVSDDMAVNELSSIIFLNKIVSKLKGE